MSNNLDTLSLLIDHINNEPDPHQKKRLWSLLGLLAKKELEKAGEQKQEDVLGDVHDYNYGLYVRFQAHEFYRNFPIPKLRNTLVDDFIQMEHERRRDNFLLFSLAVYQQIEGIINYFFFSKNLWNLAKIEFNIQIFTYSEGLKKGQRWGYSLGRTLCYIKTGESPNEKITTYLSKAPDKATFNDKFKLVLYYIYFQTFVKSRNEWDQMCNTAISIASARNQNHRGAKQFDHQSKIFEETYNNRYNNYLIFSGFLADFIHRIAAYGTDKKI